MSGYTECSGKLILTLFQLNIKFTKMNFGQINFIKLTLTYTSKLTINYAPKLTLNYTAKLTLILHC